MIGQIRSWTGDYELEIGLRDWIKDTSRLARGYALENA